MHTLRRAATAVTFATIATVGWTGVAAPAGAHDISCHTPSDPSAIGSYLECQVAASVHEREHDVSNAAWIAYCYYEYLNGRPCF